MEASAATVAHELSMAGLFLRADPVVKSVMTLLVLASVIGWGVIFDKSIRLFTLRRTIGRFEKSARRAEWSDAPAGMPEAILAAGLAEWRDRTADESRAERRERVERAMRAVLAERLRGLEAGLPFLATVGTASPFVGLFGTVWGIMNSFAAIAGTNETSLAVVAPGIAEALFATALGLVAAIPAVVGYNKLSVELSHAARRTGAVIGELGNRMARDREIS